MLELRVARLERCDGGCKGTFVSRKFDTWISSI